MTKKSVVAIVKFYKKHKISRFRQARKRLFYPFLLYRLTAGIIGKDSRPKKGNHRVMVSFSCYFT